MSLTVIEELPKPTSHSPTFIRVRCSCGRELVLRRILVFPFQKKGKKTCGCGPKGGVPKGYKQTAQHRLNNLVSIGRGPNHHSWKGDEAKPQAGRRRAEKIFKDIGPCSICGKSPAERHHKDDNPLNNEPSNIAILCRACHMKADGRIIGWQKRNALRKASA